MSDTARKGLPYIWVTWLTKLLSGEAKCLWASWYKAHFKYDKIEQADREEFLADWTAKHDAMANARADILLEKNRAIKMEDAASFSLEGRTAILAGKPDVVDVTEDPIVVYEQKSGKQRESDLWQARIYMFALPLTWAAGMGVKAFVEYTSGLKAVPALTPEDKEKIAATVRVVSAKEPPDRTPSANECKYCDIASCPERYVSAAGSRSGTDAF